MADKDLSDDKSIHASTKQAQPQAQDVLSTPQGRANAYTH
jgi:hypothetical protein